MANIAIVCPPLPGHLNPMFTLGRALVKRGHRAYVFTIPALAANVRSQGLDFEAVGAVGGDALAESIREMGGKRGLSSLRYAVGRARQLTQLLCEELPERFRAAGIELALVDQNEPAGGSVAEYLGLPFVNVCPSLPLNREPDIPPPFVPWTFRPGVWGRLRNRIGYGLSDWLIRPINGTLNRYRRGWGLRPISAPDDTFSRRAQLCQMARELDFPRRALPQSFHYLGPFCDAGGPGGGAAFPFERLNGKPLIYASLGTLQARDSRHFHTIAEACAGLEAQLVIATGGEGGDLPQGLAGEPVVVRYAPQLDLLARASLTITHAGLNTVMQSLLFGVPMVALPITHDQPAIAARMAHAGAGETIPIGRATSANLRAAVQRVMREPGYRTRAESLRDSVKAAGGVERAAAIVEDVLRNTMPRRA
ncbi:MAG: MGT family glycosyltransferase [Acidobacteriaceae bacterium]|nr:MGT family glycosyltransferase [Acidobacteriaceae bacterium]